MCLRLIRAKGRVKAMRKLIITVKDKGGGNMYVNSTIESEGVTTPSEGLIAMALELLIKCEMDKIAKKSKEGKRK